MPRKTVVCPECGKPVPTGRLACPACGSLVAAVTGPTRRATKAAAVSSGAAGATRTEAAPPESASPRGMLAAAAERGTNGTDVAVAGPPDAAVRTAAQLLGASRTMQPSKQRSAALGPNIPSVLADWPPKPPRTLDDPTGRELDRVTIAGWDLAPAAAPAASSSANPAAPVMGAYVPPSGTGAGSTYLAPSGVFNVQMQGDSAARGSHSLPEPGTGAGVTARAIAGSGSAAAAQKPPRPGSASLLADLPFDVPNTLIGWLMAFGSGAAMIGFFLPWSGVVIGAASTGGSYTETWGLASPTQLLILLVSLLGFLASVLPNRIPMWLRTSVLGLVLGGVLIGFAWPYLFASGFGYKVGVIVEIVGALVLIVAAVLSILPSRHDSESSSV
jgi:hypothetical protein